MHEEWLKKEVLWYLQLEKGLTEKKKKRKNKDNAHMAKC